MFQNGERVKSSQTTSKKPSPAPGLRVDLEANSAWFTSKLRFFQRHTSQRPPCKSDVLKRWDQHSMRPFKDKAVRATSLLPRNLWQSDPNALHAKDSEWNWMTWRCFSHPEENAAVPSQSQGWWQLLPPRSPAFLKRDVSNFWCRRCAKMCEVQKALCFIESCGTGLFCRISLQNLLDGSPVLTHHDVRPGQLHRWSVYDDVSGKPKALKNPAWQSPARPLWRGLHPPEETIRNRLAPSDPH